MFETVFDVTAGGLFVDEVGELQIVHHPLKLFAGFADQCLDQALLELSPNYRQGLEQVLFDRWKAVNARGENALDRWRNFQTVKRPRELHRTVPHKGAILKERLYHFLHEERIALGP